MALHIHERSEYHLKICSLNESERKMLIFVDIELHPNNINTEDGFSLCRLWKPLLCDLREHKLAPNTNIMSSGEP
jgi:hypothetical protein